MTDTFRALCAELVDKLHDLTFNDESAEEDGTWELIDRARAALAEPLPPDKPVSAAYTLEPPADGEVAELVTWLREQREVLVNGPPTHA
jgi:hypothetical protein